ncbi:MAG: diguanylate cyclase [Halarcobacter sp.]
MNKNKTILVVDDTETNIDILLGLLEGYDLVVAIDGISAIKIAQEEKIDLILLDIMMPGIDGYEVCKQLKQKEDTKDIPIIFITAKTDENSIEIAYDIGGVDYVTKPFKPKELLARVKQQLEIRSLIENLEFLASRDPMTGILNRRKFFELSQKLFENDELFAVMIDIDRFKKINDIYGHDIGDKVIIKVTNIINSYLEEDEIFGRLGGEEFAIISIKPMEEKIKKILKEIQEDVVLTNENKEVKFTISSGIAKKDITTKNLDLLLKLADDNLYEAKELGRNRIVYRTKQKV